MATPYVTIVRNVVASTQDLAASELSRSGRPVLVVAREQTSGRGRSGRVWHQAPQAVAASFAFPTEGVGVGDAFSLTVGLAVREAIKATTGVEVGLKWPNDIQVDGRKVGGILVEMDEQRVVVGCGLNLVWPDPPEGIGALLTSSPSPDLARILSEGWVERVLSAGDSWDREAYVQACTTIGTRVTWEPGGTGMAVGVDQDGGLVVDSPEGRRVLRSGEVRAVRTSGSD